MSFPAGAARHRGVLAPLVGGTVLLAAVLAVAGLVVLGVRTGGLGYGVFAVPFGVLALLVGAGGWALTAVPSRGWLRRTLGVVLAIAATGLLLAIAAYGFLTQPSTGA